MLLVNHLGQMLEDGTDTDPRKWEASSQKSLNDDLNVHEDGRGTRKRKKQPSLQAFGQEGLHRYIYSLWWKNREGVTSPGNRCSSENDLQAEWLSHKFGFWVDKRLKDAPKSRHIPIFTKHTTLELILGCSCTQQCKTTTFHCFWSFIKVIKC